MIWQAIVSFLKPTKGKIIVFFLFATVYLLLNYLWIFERVSSVLAVCGACIYEYSGIITVCYGELQQPSPNITRVNQTFYESRLRCEQAQNKTSIALESTLKPIEQTISTLSFGVGDLTNIIDPLYAILIFAPRHGIGRLELIKYLWKTYLTRELPRFLYLILCWYIASSFIVYFSLKLKKIFFSKSKSKP
jgi:hypothetical protein